jgi:hypothetical protein
MKRARFSASAPSSGSSSAHHIADPPCAAAHEFLTYLVDLWKIGDLSAKTLCTICHLAAEAGAEGARPLGVDTKTSGDPSKHIISKSPPPSNISIQAHIHIAGRRLTYGLLQPTTNNESYLSRTSRCECVLLRGFEHSADLADGMEGRWNDMPSWIHR